MRTPVVATIPGARAVSGFDQPSAELSGVFEVERSQPRRGMGLIKGIHRFDENHPAVRQEQQLVNGFAGRKKKGPVIKVYLDLVFGFEFGDQPRRGISNHHGSMR